MRLRINQQFRRNGVTVVIHRLTQDQVYFARFRGEIWNGSGWPLLRMKRAEFERAIKDAA